MNHLEIKKEELTKILLDRIDYSRNVEDDEVKELIDEVLTLAGRKNLLSIEEKKQLRKDLFYRIRKLDILQELIDDPEITEIMINGPNDIYIEKKGKVSKYPLRFSAIEKLEDIIQQIVAECNRVVNEASPIVDARLYNGSRVNVVLAPVAINGPIVTIRKFPEHPMRMEQLVDMGAISLEIVQWLEKLVQAKYNIFICGGTGSGKTTFLNALSQYIPEDERIITIEDSAELQLLEQPNLVSLETRNTNVEGCKEITIRDLIKTSLRMRPDRIIVGEVRGGEAFDMMQAMNTGMEGSMSTGHANSCADMLSRLENMILMGMDLPLQAIRKQIGSGIDILIHLGRLRDGSRKLLEIVEITGYENNEIQYQTLYQYRECRRRETEKIEGNWEKKGELQFVEKLYTAGIWVS